MTSPRSSYLITGNINCLDNRIIRCFINDNVSEVSTSTDSEKSRIILVSVAMSVALSAGRELLKLEPEVSAVVNDREVVLFIPT